MSFHQSHSLPPAIFRQPGSHCTAVHVSTSAQAAQEPPSTLGHSTCIGVGRWFMARKSGEVARFLPVSCKIPWNAEVASRFPGENKPTRSSGADQAKFQWSNGQHSHHPNQNLEGKMFKNGTNQHPIYESSMVYYTCSIFPSFNQLPMKWNKCSRPHEAICVYPATTNKLWTWFKIWGPGRLTNWH